MAAQNGAVPGKLRSAGQRVRLGLPCGADGAHLVEFALLLPFLVVLTIAIFDFGAAYKLQQKLTNAAREGARIAVGQNTVDLSSTSCPSSGASSPCTVEATRNAVVNYLASENLVTSFIATNPTKTGPQEWTYSSTATSAPVLVIDRGVAIVEPVSGKLIVSTRVTLSYPYSWSFDRIIRLLAPSASLPGSFSISTQVVMENMT